MSSGWTVTGGGAEEEEAAVPLGQKLMVLVPENGQTLEFQCGGDTLVEAIQHSIQLHCGILPGDQLLLCGNTSLDGANALASYKLPRRDDREVFLYNKSSAGDGQQLGDVVGAKLVRWKLRSIWKAVLRLRGQQPGDVAGAELVRWKLRKYGKIAP